MKEINPGKVGPERVKEIMDFWAENGDVETLKVFDLKHQTLDRYKRDHKKFTGEKIDQRRDKLLNDIGDKYTDEELKLLAKGSKAMKIGKKVVIDREGEEFRIGHITDTHIGSKYFNEDFLFDAFKRCSSEGVDFIAHSGDVCEGMSHRRGHVFECSEIGFRDQKNKAVDLLSRWTGKMYLIDGNHDRWFTQASGAWIVEDITQELPDAEFLGEDEGDIFLNNCHIKLWHGLDGSSYATSYRLQKVVEAFTGGEKPQVLLTGHTHKQAYIFERNIHVVSGGAICMQTKWMRGKRLANHTGFHIITMTINKKGEVTRFSPEFFPFYS